MKKSFLMLLALLIMLNMAACIPVKISSSAGSETSVSNRTSAPRLTIAPTETPVPVPTETPAPTEVPADVAMADALSKLDQVKSLHMDTAITMEVNLRLSEQGMKVEMPVSAVVETHMDMQTDPYLVKTELAVTEKMGEAKVQLPGYLLYGDYSGDVPVVYASLDEGITWTVTETEGIRAMSPGEALALVRGNATDVQYAGTETFDGYEVAVYTCRLEGKYMDQVLDAAGMEGMLSEIIDTDDAELDFTDLGDIPVTLYVDGEGYPVYYCMDMTESMEALAADWMELVMGLEELEDLDMAMDVVFAKGECTLSKFDGVEPIVIPEAALNAKTADAAPLPSETEDPGSPTAVPDDADPLAEGMGCWFGDGPNGYDMEKAQIAFQRAADEGSADAWYWLGVLAEAGVAEGHYKQAFGCYQKAVDLGSDLGRCGLAGLLTGGKGVEKDVEKAAAYYQQTVDAGCLYGYIGLGGLALDGLARYEKDGAKALEYYMIAEASDDWFTRNQARCSIGRLFRYGAEGVEKGLDKAMEWYQKAADEGYVIAFVPLAYMYAHPEGSDPADWSKAIEFYEKAAACGRPYNLGVCYTQGSGVEKDRTRAIEYFMLSVNGGRDAVDSLAILAMCYYQGNGVKMDPVKAREYADRCFTAAAVDPSEVDGSSPQSPGVEVAKWVLNQLDG